jgi:glycosyltransferase involved in cell wall biosynthesis
MACRVPTVVSDVGGLPELVVDEETGYLCPVDDVDAFSDRILALLQNEELHGRMSEAARTRAEETFDIDTVVPKYEQYYEQVKADTTVPET